MARDYINSLLAKSFEQVRSTISQKYNYEIFKPMRRRKQIQSSSIEAQSIPRSTSKDRKPGLWLTSVSLMSWLVGLLYCGLGILIDEVLKRPRIISATRFRRTLEKMGPGAVKVGQQFSMRVDVLPEEYCDELSKILDQMPPFPINEAIAVIERTLGKPLDETFESFDPVPIGSASLACVYQAMLPSGELVAVKVKRPHIARKMAADLKALSLIFNLAEQLGILRIGFTKSFLPELSRMASEEADFVLEARYTEIFRKLAKKNKFVSAPKIYSDLSNDQMIVSEFVTGVFLIEIVNAIDQNNQEAIARLKSEGIDFVKVSKNMVSIFYWEIFETEFFHADPHPANVIVKPDNTLVMIDFGSCGTISGPFKRKLKQLFQHMFEEDLNAIAQDTITVLEPLPPMNTYAFSHELINIYRDFFIASKSKKVAWYEKSTGAIWMKISAISRQYNLPMQLELVRYFRACFVYDSIIYRINPDIDPQKEFKKWEIRFDKKNRRSTLKEIQKRLGGPLDEDFTSHQEMNRLLKQFLQKMQSFMDKPNYDFGNGVRKVAFVFSTIIKSTISAVSIFVLFVILKTVYQGLTDPMAIFGDGYIVTSFKYVAKNPLFISVLIIFIYIKTRIIVKRMDDIDTS